MTDSQIEALIRLTAPTTRRMFYIDGDRQMVRELDGTAHEADPNDPELLAAAARTRAYLAEDVAESFEGRLAAALIEYLHTVSSYIDFSATCGRGNTDHDHREAEDLAHELAAIDERLRSG